MKQRWSNWSGKQTAYPDFLQPKNVDELKKIVRKHDKIRMVGAGHSFSPLATTDDVMVNLDHIQGVHQFNAQKQQCTLHAGTRLYKLGECLAPIHQALQNQGDIDHQSLAGVVATGTHGTGVDLPCLSALVTDFELLTAEGEVLQCSPEHNAEIFQAGRVALGSFGVMTKITLQNRSRYKLKEQLRLCALSDIYQYIDRWKHQHRHIEFWAFLHSDQVILKTLDESRGLTDPRPQHWLSEDRLLNFCSEITRVFPQLNPYLQSLLGVFIKPSTHVDWSSQIFPTPRNTKFNEMEYQLLAEQGLACLEELLAVLKQQRVAMFFPIEFRYVKGDDIWLSPFYGRDSVSISIHQFYKQDCQHIFKWVEPILQKYQGRPHWGKLHSMQADQLRELYPKWDDFMQLREQLDPQQKWINPYLRQIFTIPSLSAA
ncbi:D-arabinono-1,4-lactone oxidase [Acinetobacter sp. Lyrl_1]|uniref:D-arabinono-1,4-lactone oxidase n=1 Tax=Acinetobacter sp. Lyrl_1 TaxID=3110920 RepID=UPI003F7C150E